MNPGLEAAEVDALRVIFTSLGATVADVGGWTVLSRPDRPGHPWMHQVVARGAVSADDLDVAMALAGPTAQVQVPDGALIDEAPADAVLADRGLVVWSRLVRLVAPAPGAPAVTDLALVRVGREAAHDVVAVALAGFDIGEPEWFAAPLGAPGWTQVVAYDGAVPVATGALHVRGPVGWVGAASTVPGRRRQGAQSALLARRLQLAAAHGATRVVAKVDPGSGSERNLRRAGFAPVYGVVQWRPR